MKMVGAKILLAFWLTTILVVTVANAIAPEELRRPELVRQAVQVSLQAAGQSMVRAYEKGGCAALATAFPDGTLSLADASGQMLCSRTDSDSSAFIRHAHAASVISSHRYATYQLVALPLAASGRSYVVLLKSKYLLRSQVFGWMPGLTTWAISGGVTLALALLFTLPIRRLRVAARQIATGNLSARVQWGISNRRDEVGGLIGDFNTMAARLQELVEAQRMLLRDVSHELRSPLSRLGVALELARDEASDSMTVHLDRMERETTKLNNLISQLLSLSYMDTMQSVQRTNLSLNSVIADLLPDVQYEASGRHCHIVATMVRDCMVRGDAGLLHRALENIIRNAIHYTPEYSVVNIDLNTREEGGLQQAVLCVTDDGPGVPEEELEAILRPFYRVDRSRQSSTGGFGIGLAIADRAVRLHDGGIVARNCPTGGLAVEIRLPI
jgi:two-component system, OmpR family, sensor histidine kinase CpxA